MPELNKEFEVKISFKSLLKQMPTVAKFMLTGLTIISFIVIYDFFRLVAEPGPLVPGEDLYIHVALLILVPISCLGLFGISFGYAYYQICKTHKIKPFWVDFMR